MRPGAGLLIGVTALAIAAGRGSHAQDPVYASVAPPPGLAPGGFMAAIAAGDLDGDGDIDVLAGDALGTISYFRNEAGPAGPPTYVELVGGTNPLGSAALGFAATVAIADLDRDGDLDVLAGRGDGSFSYFQNTAGPATTPVFAAPVLNPFGLTDVGANSAPALADIDGDGDQDVLAGRTAGTIVYFENVAAPLATPSFVERTGAANPLATVDVGWSSIPNVGDLDGDGDLDVVTGDVLGNLTLSRNAAGPGAPPAFEPPLSNPFGLADVGFTSSPGLVDLDRDGDLDLLAGTSVGTVAHFGNVAGNPLAVRLVGTEGWRMLGAPIPTVSLGTFLGPIWTQGVPGADNPGGLPNVLRYDETVTGGTDAGFVAPPSMTEAVGAGRGFFAYVYEDDDMVTPGTQGGFPKVIPVTGSPRTTPFTWGTAGSGSDGLLSYTNTGSASADGWNLLANPFASWFDWDATVSAGMDAVAYVYDPAIASYRTYSRGVGGSIPGGIIGAFQAFFVHVTAPASTITAPPAPADGGPVYGLTTEPAWTISLALHPGADSDLPRELSSHALLALGVVDARPDVDGSDAYALGPPSQSFLYLATIADGPGDESALLAIDARPEADSRAEIELAVAAIEDGAPAEGVVELRWPAPSGVPEGWTVSLHDREAGVVVPMDSAGVYAFDLSAEPRGDGSLRLTRLGPTLGPTHLSEAGGARLALVVEQGVTTGNEPLPSELAIATVRPNPVSTRGTLSIEMPRAGEATVEIVDLLGRRVALLAQGPRAAGRHSIAFDASQLLPGVYIARLRAEGREDSSRVTVVR